MPLTKENVPVQFADIPNPVTGHVYPLEILEQIAAKGVVARFGELREGPAGDIAMLERPGGLGVIGLASASHTSSNLRVVDGTLVADITTLESTKGEELEKLLGDPTQTVSFRLRGFADMTPERQITLFEMVTIDAIHVK